MISIIHDLYEGCSRQSETKSLAMRIVRLLANKTDAGMTKIIGSSIHNFWVNYEPNLQSNVDSERVKAYQNYNSWKIPSTMVIEGISEKGENSQKINEIISGSVLIFIGLIDSPNFRDTFYTKIWSSIAPVLSQIENPSLKNCFLIFLKYFSLKLTSSKKQENKMISEIVFLFLDTMNHPETSNSVIFYSNNFLVFCYFH